MDLQDAIRERHAVRSYTDQPIPTDVAEKLQAAIDDANAQGDLHLQLALDEPDAFDSFIAHYGHFHGVRNYLCCVGRKGPDMDRKVGYFGEQVVLLAKMLGLDSCWVALTFNRRKAGCTIARGEKMPCVISLGYAAAPGHAHASKDMGERFVIAGNAPAPDWFMRGMQAAMLAPTAVNQQRFRFHLLPGNVVRAEATGGANSKIDLGIVQYHFEAGAGCSTFTWDDSSRIG